MLFTPCCYWRSLTQFDRMLTNKLIAHMGIRTQTEYHINLFHCRVRALTCHRCFTAKHTHTRAQTYLGCGCIRVCNIDSNWFTTGFLKIISMKIYDSRTDLKKSVWDCIVHLRTICIKNWTLEMSKADLKWRLRKDWKEIYIETMILADGAYGSFFQYILAF